jgi:hypothetical protein
MMLKITESNELIKSLFEMDFFWDETKNRVINADILLLPEIGVIDGIEKAFRPDTKKFLKFIGTNYKGTYNVEMFENTGEENVLNFHSLDIYLPVIYLKNKNLVADVIDIVSQFVDFRIKYGQNDKPTVILILKVEHDEICKVFTYKGSVEGLKKSFVENRVI